MNSATTTCSNCKRTLRLIPEIDLSAFYFCSACNQFLDITALPTSSSEAPRARRPRSLRDIVGTLFHLAGFRTGLFLVTCALVIPIFDFHSRLLAVLVGLFVIWASWSLRQEAKSRIRHEAEATAVTPADLSHVEVPKSLGRPVAIFKPNKSLKTAFLFVGFFFAGGGTLLCLAELPGYDRLMRMVLGIGCIPIGFIFLWLALFSDYSLCVFFFSEGLAKIQRENLESASWSQITDFWYEKHQSNADTPPTYAFALRNDLGERIEIKDTLSNHNYARLGALIEEETFRRLFPRLAGNVAQGRTVEFGPLAINKDGIEYAGSLALWQDVIAVSASGEHCYINRCGCNSPWRIAISEIPNYKVFETLAQSHCSRE